MGFSVAKSVGTLYVYVHVFTLIIQLNFQLSMIKTFILGGFILFTLKNLGISQVLRCANTAGYYCSCAWSALHPSTWCSRFLPSTPMQQYLGHEIEEETRKIKKIWGKVGKIWRNTSSGNIRSFWARWLFVVWDQYCYENNVPMWEKLSVVSRTPKCIIMWKIG